MIDRAASRLSVVRQCALLGICRSMVYYRPAPPDEQTLALMRRIDAVYTDHPHMGSRQLARALRRQGERGAKGVGGGAAAGSPGRR
jgi:putative transposase